MEKTLTILDLKLTSNNLKNPIFKEKISSQGKQFKTYYHMSIVPARFGHSILDNLGYSFKRESKIVIGLKEDVKSFGVKLAKTLLEPVRLTT